jgi:hypothetical protein
MAGLKCFLALLNRAAATRRLDPMPGPKTRKKDKVGEMNNLTS